MMTRRRVAALLTLMLAAGANDLARAAQSAKTTTVTLTIDGMTWEGCIEAVRSALLSVKGVTRAQVRLAENEAIVTYDPEQAKIEDLIKAVSEAEGPTGQRYSARVKKEKPNAS